MTIMTGGQALARSLHIEGVRVIFGLPGVQLYHLMDALHDEPEIKFILTRHEQATTYMADGYARASGKVGTAMVVPGPGLQNASAGIGTAYAASSPILVVSGQIERDLIGIERGALHEINDQIDTIRPVTKWARRILEPTEIPAVVREAFRQLNTGRPRPVEIEVPPETLAEEANIDLCEPERFERAGAHSQDVDLAADLIIKASNPLFWVGGGAISSGASDALRELSEYLQTPVITTAEGRGIISDRHHLSIGSFRFRNDPYVDRITEHDLIIAIGTRLAFPDFVSHSHVLQIDIDKKEIGRNHPNTTGVVGDARLTLEAIYKSVRARLPMKASRKEELTSLKNQRFSKDLQIEPQASYTRAIRQAMPDDGILVSGMTQIGYYSRAHYPVYEPGTYLTSSYYGNLGYAFPLALGAKVACPSRPVVAISGDGGFLFNSQELATAKQHGINAIVIVFNDNAYGNVLRDQVTRFQGRTYGARLHNPDFVKLACAYGIRAVQVDGPDQLERALSESLSLKEPSLIEVPVDMMPSPLP